jgi:exopolysaccharide production protein ExoQ
MNADRFGTGSETGIRWRRFECWGAGLCLFLQSGALIPLALSDPDGGLSDPSRAKLRFVALPVYAFTAFILYRNFPRFLKALRQNLYVPALPGLAFLSVLWSVGPPTTLLRAVGLLFTMLLAYVLAIRFSPKQLLLIVLLTLGVSMVLSIMLLAAMPGLARTASDGTLRGIFLNKNSMGWYACITTLLAMVALIDGTIRSRRTACILLVAGGFCLIGSGSMTAIIATLSTFALIPFYLILQKARGAGRMLVVLLAVQGAACLLLLLHNYLVPLLESLGKDATLTGRIPLWELVDRQIAEHLLLGFGYQTFWIDRNLAAWDIWSQIGWLAPHAHNGFRDTLLSFGLIGMSLFTLVLVRALRQGAVLQCQDPHYGWLWLNVFTGVVLVMNLTESIFLVQNDTIFILFCTGLIMFSLYAPAASFGLQRMRRMVREGEPMEQQPV